MAWRPEPWRRLGAVLAWLVLTCWAMPAWASPEAAVLQPQDERIALWRNLLTVADPQGLLTPGQAAAEVAAGRAGPLRHANASQGTGLPYPYWAWFELHNPGPSPQRWLITYEQPIQDATALWQLNSNGSSMAWTPLRQPEEERPLALGSGHLYPVWRVELPPGATTRFMLRIDGHNLMRFPIYAMQDEAYVQQQRALHLGLGFVLAVPLVVVLYVLTLVRAAEDRSLPLFLAMAACETVGATWVCGLMHEAFPWIDRWTAGWIGWAAYVAMLGLSCQHARVFMRTRARDGLADAVLTAGAWIWLAGVPLLVALQPDTVRLSLVLGGTLHAFVMTWLALRGLRRQPGAVMGLFVSVWIVYAVTAVLYVLYRVADLPVYVSLMSSFIQGSLVAALLGCAVSLRIVRRRAELQQQMERAQDRSLLYATAHHDLLQPLQAIGLYMQALPSAGAAKRWQLLLGMNAALGAVNEFLSGLHQLADHHGLPLNVKRHSLEDVLKPVIDEYRHWCEAGHITLNYRAARMHLCTDARHLQRIVRNLLSNALRYTSAGGRILVGLRRQAGRRWLVVADTGCGMSAEQVEHCFEAFKRFAPAQRAPEGMGLGLYSVKQTAHALGLQTRLFSVLGRGTAVWVSLPEAIDERAVDTKEGSA